MLNPWPPLYEMEENEEQFEPGQRIVPESFGDGFEWYEHALRLEQLRLEQQEQQEMFLSNEEALIEANEAHCSIMKREHQEAHDVEQGLLREGVQNYIEQE